MTATTGDAFDRARPRLFGIAYRMLSSVAEAEDVVGDVAERWASTDHDGLREPEGWLVTVTARRALDVARSARLQRVDYPGEWLPEPLLTSGGPDAAVERHETLTTGFLLLLERLTPLERAVFVLHDVFEHPYALVADAVGRSEAACRQALHRARQHVTLPQRTATVDPARAEAAASRFMAAIAGGSIDDLVSVLAPDVALTSDGGGVVQAAFRTVRGADRVARLFHNLVARSGPDPFVLVCQLNGEPALVAHGARGWASVTISAGADGCVDSLRIVVHPAKLQPLLDQLGADVAGLPDARSAAVPLRHRGGRPVDGAGDVRDRRSVASPERTTP